ncbi:circadian clock KaiB family protein [Mucilaginibacter myungsuensis]|uniref:Circadian clock KaiB family protein n=1 Tax=Mucilaginibacter myungsuensis TaxID=649104 RepID=A0A929KXD3_9SPHI|nr:circadian clock KaiB family protein [Mucilaginibacter myungsuensis]MBE9662203.1 circadian clock KaiB family protein [Mucilaginibacter myungsuensis]MDN3599363.1 circadian clock KaiB family protein [Mucilaginibacter myungsuensis]
MKANKWLNEGNSPHEDNSYTLRLFITGASPNSTRAVENLKSFCDKYLVDRYQLEIIDVYQQPDIAEKEQIIALPLLLKKGGGPDRRLIGDMSDINKLAQCFNIDIKI